MSSPRRSAWRTAEASSISSPKLPPFHTGPTAWITHFAGSLPAFVTTAWPTAQVPIWSHSSWIVGPPFTRMAPATPEPSCSASFAALTIASTRICVMSVFESSIVAATCSLRLRDGSSQPLRNRVGDPQIRLRDGRLRISRDDGPSRIAAEGDLRVERDLAQERDAELLGRPPAAAVLEDLLAVPALGAQVVRHVLDDAEDGDVDLLEHREALARVDERDVLRRRDDDGPGQVDLLRQRQLGVAGPGRKVDDEVVERAPRDVLEELLDRLHDHRPAPDDRLVDVHEEPERHDLDAVALDRNDLVRLVDVGLLVDPHHHLLRRPVDVGVHEAHAVADALEGEGEVGRDGRFADAALAGRDRNRVADVPQDRAGWRAGSGGGARRGRGGGRLDVEPDGHRVDALEAAELLRGVPPDLLGRRRRFGRDLEAHGHIAAADREVLDEAEGDDVPRQSRKPDGPQDLQDLLLGQLRRRAHGSCSSRGDSTPALASSRSAAMPARSVSVSAPRSV